MKKVIYNGGTNSYGYSSAPELLDVGREYIVVNEDVHDFYTNYTLEGVEGKFNSAWFDVVNNEKKAFMAITRTLPKVGKSCECYKLEFKKGQGTMTSWITSTVRDVLKIADGMYRVETCNSIYIVQVIA